MNDVTPAEELTGIGDNEPFEPMTPPQWEAEMARTRLRIARGVKETQRLRKVRNRAARHASRQYARAYINAKGAQYERRYRAEIDESVIQAQDDADVADEAFRYALDILQELRDDQTALQSVGKSVMSVYFSETGRG
jgi:hypothetical protein